MYCVSRTSAIIFEPSIGAITDNCQSAKDTDTYFKSQIYVENIGLPAVDGLEPTTSRLTICLTTRTPPLIANLKTLNFRQWNQSWFSNPLSIISSYQHFQIPHDRQIEVNIGLFKPLFNQSEAGILVGGMTMLNNVWKKKHHFDKLTRELKSRNSSQVINVLEIRF